MAIDQTALAAAPVVRSQEEPLNTAAPSDDDQVEATESSDEPASVPIKDTLQPARETDPISPQAEPTEAMAPDTLFFLNGSGRSDPEHQTNHRDPIQSGLPTRPAPAQSGEGNSARGPQETLTGPAQSTAAYEPAALETRLGALASVHAVGAAGSSAKLSDGWIVNLPQLEQAKTPSRSQLADGHSIVGNVEKSAQIWSKAKTSGPPPRTSDGAHRAAPYTLGPAQAPPTTAPQRTTQITPRMSQLIVTRDEAALLHSLDIAERDAGATPQTTALSPAEARSPSPLATLLARADTPAMIARQLAGAIPPGFDRPVELSLNPEELGRVRMTIASGEAGVSVSIIAERPETLDLMRRHIDQLHREFQSLGYDKTAFSFSGGQHQPDERTTEPPRSPSDLTTASPDPASPTSLILSDAEGLDIRL